MAHGMLLILWKSYISHIDVIYGVYVKKIADTYDLHFSR